MFSQTSNILVTNQSPLALLVVEARGHLVSSAEKEDCAVAVCGHAQKHAVNEITPKDP